MTTAARTDPPGEDNGPLTGGKRAARLHDARLTFRCGPEFTAPRRVVCTRPLRPRRRSARSPPRRRQVRRPVRSRHRCGAGPSPSGWRSRNVVAHVFRCKKSTAIQDGEPAPGSVIIEGKPLGGRTDVDPYAAKVTQRHSPQRGSPSEVPAARCPARCGTGRASTTRPRIAREDAGLGSRRGLPGTRTRNRASTPSRGLPGLQLESSSRHTRMTVEPREKDHGVRDSRGVLGSPTKAFQLDGGWVGGVSLPTSGAAPDVVRCRARASRYSDQLGRARRFPE
jgi:hypothetical protein